MMDRRSFLKNTVLISGGTILAPSLLRAETIGLGETCRNLTILHTNDTHSNIEPFPENHRKYPGQGGVSRRYELIQKIRNEESNVLLLDAGDIFQGTPYFNKYGGVLEMKVMTAMGYEAGTMGNHDFDAGTEGFVKARQYADFDFICSNYDFTNTPIEGFTTKEKIIEKGGLKIGLFGLGVELDGLVPDDKFGETKYLDPIEIATDHSASLKKQGCDLVICLSHLGYEYSSDKVSDLQLAAATKDIHLIIGGHTHTFLDKPTEAINSEGKIVLINQVGWAGINLGRVDFCFENGNFKNAESILVKA